MERQIAEIKEELAEVKIMLQPENVVRAVVDQLQKALDRPKSESERIFGMLAYQGQEIAHLDDKLNRIIDRISK